jgi:hypothetical protein
MMLEHLLSVPSSMARIHVWSLEGAQDIRGTQLVIGRSDPERFLSKLFICGCH